MQIRDIRTLTDQPIISGGIARVLGLFLILGTGPQLISYNDDESSASGATAD